jgi:hypothetical protein
VPVLPPFCKAINRKPRDLPSCHGLVTACHG